MQLKKDHITFSSTKDMLEISKPLDILGVNFFSYTRFYDDGTSISLLTHSKWYEFFLEQEVPGCVNVFNLETGFTSWADLFPEKAVADARNMFNIDSGVHFAFNHGTYVEAISYASHSGCKDALYTFIANKDLLERFTSYFKEKADRLIDNSLKSKITIPEIMRGYQNKENIYTLGAVEREKFFQAIQHLDLKRILTKREYECLHHISHSKTVKNVAKEMKVSPKTVEAHLANIKCKMKCSNKTDLAKIFWSNSLC